MIGFKSVGTIESMGQGLGGRARRSAWAMAVTLALGASGPSAIASDHELLFSTSGNADYYFGRMLDEEIARLRLDGEVRPWFRNASGAFFLGDVDADGVPDEWNDVDALWVGGTSARLEEMRVSLLSDAGEFLDGDVLRPTDRGGLERVHSESRFVTDFGIEDGNCDVDAYHDTGGGIVWLSFAEDEASSVLETDDPGEIADGAILWWEVATGAVGVVATEARVGEWVGHALGSAPVDVKDVLAISADDAGVLHFGIQSPSAHDGSVFSDRDEGTLEHDESEFGFLNSAELDALHWSAAAPAFATTHVPLRVVPDGTSWVIEVSAEASTDFVVLCALARGDASAVPGPGFGGLFLDPLDPLLWFSMSSPHLRGTTDDEGWASLTLPPTPSGWSGTLLGQVYDRTGKAFGTPVAVYLE